MKSEEKARIYVGIWTPVPPQVEEVSKEYMEDYQMVIDSKIVQETITKDISNEEMRSFTKKAQKLMEAKGIKDYEIINGKIYSVLVGEFMKVKEISQNKVSDLERGLLVKWKN